jgi:eukaryotic-like serine/threonine-protein kinase
MIDPQFIAFQEALAGEYSLERELGRGGMGVVYLAREVQLDRLVAIKVLPPELATRRNIREQFLREARTAAGLSHPNIVPIYRVGERGGFVFFVMAYVRGETLGERLRAHGPLASAAATRIFRDVAWALAYAHGHGVVHRDVKPDNILIEAGTERALVSDFGIAVAHDGASIDEPGRIMGTAQFMSPEQAVGEPLDGRSDLYSLGVVAYLALSGHLPVQGSNTAALLAQHVNVTPPPLRDVAAGVPSTLAAVVERCLEKSPDRRWPNGEAVAEALEKSATPTRTRMPMALRVWTQATDPLRPVYIVWSGLFTMGTISELFGSRRDWGVTLAFALAPLIPLTIFHARKAFQALAAGYTLRDLRAALQVWQADRREELAFEHGGREPRWMGIVRALTVSLVAASAAVMATGPHRSSIRMAIVQASVLLGAAVSTAISTSLGVSFIPRGVRASLVGALRSKIWNSRAGEWAARLLAPKYRSRAIDADERPTEMALGLAAEELFAALPSAYRQHLGDVPEIVRRLEAHASVARRRVADLNTVMTLGRDVPDSNAIPSADETPAGLAEARETAQRELTSAVTALEALRLDLLRLHGAGASPDLRPLTTTLDAARRLGVELDRLTQADRDVRRIAPLPIFEITPPTPA